MKEDLTIFYTDDDIDDLDFFKDVACAIGDNITVYTQDRGDKLLQALDSQPPSPQIIFLDLNMPGKNGFEVLKDLKNKDEWKHIPVVIFSTSDDEQSISKSRQLGASYYLPKQSSFEEFKKSIQHTLSINWKTFIPSPTNFIYRTH